MPGPVFGETTTKGKVMLKVWRAFFAHHKHNERGSAEFATALMVFPVLFVLIIGSIEIGFYVQTRMRVENIAREAARSVAADGGNYNIATNTSGKIDAKAQLALTGDHSFCKLSKCTKAPKITCDHITRLSGAKYNSQRVDYAGETVTCEVLDYPYKGLSGGLMDAPVLGLGIGSILKPFTVRESARSETGKLG